MATYLAAVQIGRYQTTEVPGSVAQQVVFPSRLPVEAVAAFARQEQMMDLFVDLFGPYPFDAYTAVVTDDELEIPVEAQGMSTFGLNHLDGSPDSERLIAHRRRLQPHVALHISAEDLTNLGPVALLQDLAAVAALGISHVERNGHHYFAGLSQFPSSVQGETLRHHSDLYTSHRGYPIVAVQAGKVDIGSVVEAPFGTAFETDLAEFTPADDWRYESLESV